MENILFISNSLFVNPASKNGGVKICTDEFISLLKTKFEVNVFEVNYNLSFAYRARVKMGINVYNDYKVSDYEEPLRNILKSKNIKYVFLNLSNTITFSPILKKIGGSNLKIILCSHGNETGDLLHDIVRSKERFNRFSLFTSSYLIGELLKKEAYYRINFIDLVLTISDIEENIEKWIGAKNTFTVPRVIICEKIDLQPILNRVGFFGDLSHAPNYIGVEMICNEIEKKKINIDFRLIGGPNSIGDKLSKKYPFVKYLGYLSEEDLKSEVASWAYFLNLVFYYSRGVSTKLAKALSLGLPVISTLPGIRGYKWEEGNINISGNAKEMSDMIQLYASDINKINFDQQEVKKIVSSSLSLNAIMIKLVTQLEKL
jgi:hypothetical protein